MSKWMEWSTKWTIERRKKKESVREKEGEAVDVSLSMCIHPTTVIHIPYIYAFVYNSDTIFSLVLSLMYDVNIHCTLHLKSNRKFEARLCRHRHEHTHWNINEILEISDEPILTQHHRYHRMRSIYWATLFSTRNRCFDMSMRFKLNNKLLIRSINAINKSPLQFGSEWNLLLSAADCISVFFFFCCSHFQILWPLYCMHTK